MAETKAPTASQAEPWSPGDILLGAAGFGMLAGGIEAAAAFIRQRVMRLPLVMGPELGWQLPLSDLAVFVVLAVPLVVAGLAWRRARVPGVVLGYLVALTAVSAVFLFERWHPAAKLLLALAVAIPLSRLLLPCALGLRRWQRIVVPGVLAVLLVMGAVDRLARPAVERKAIAAVRAPVESRPNVLIVVLNAVRAWNLGAYGYGRATTPKLDQWGTHGTVFLRALAPAGGTTLSHGVLWTGRHPTELSVSRRLRYDGAYPTLALELRRAGYTTAAFVGDYPALGRGTGLNQGFVHYEDYPFQPFPVLRQTSIVRRLLELAPVARLVGARRLAEVVPAARLNQRMLHWLEGQSGRPWFAFLHYAEADEIRAVPASFATRYLDQPDAPVDRYWQALQDAYGPPVLPLEVLARGMDGYDGAISYLDIQVDSLLRALGDRGALANTIVVVTADHGKLFGEHGVVGHDNNLYLPTLHVPLMIIAPGRVPRATRVASLAPLRNLPVTVLQLAGIQVPGFPGRTLAPLWTPNARLIVDTAFAAMSPGRSGREWALAPVRRGELRSVMLDSLHYLRNGDGTEELYHLGIDFWETCNLADAPHFRTDLDRHRRALETLLRR